MPCLAQPAAAGGAGGERGRAGRCPQLREGAEQPPRGHAPTEPPPAAIITILNSTNLAVCFARAEAAFLIAGKTSSFETEIETK